MARINRAPWCRPSRQGRRVFKPIQAIVKMMMMMMMMMIMIMMMMINTDRRSIHIYEPNEWT